MVETMNSSEGKMPTSPIETHGYKYPQDMAVRLPKFRDRSPNHPISCDLPGIFVCMYAADFKASNLTLSNGLAVRSADAWRSLLKKFDTLRQDIDDSDDVVICCVGD